MIIFVIGVGGGGGDNGDGGDGSIRVLTFYITLLCQGARYVRAHTFQVKIIVRIHSFASSLTHTHAFALIHL